MKPLYSITDLDWYYEKRQVLSGITGEIKAGSFTGIIGPNGSGKTTLLKLLLGMLPAKKGAVHLNGKELGAYTHRERARLLSYVPQRPESFFPYTAEELVRMGRYPYLSGWKTYNGNDKALVDKIIRQLDLQALRNNPMQTLSGGEVQRVLLGRALAQEAQCILLDEPTNHLDIHYQLSLLQDLKTRIQKEATVVSVFHDINLALQYADDLILLEEGKLVYQGPGSSLVESPLLDRVFQVRFQRIPSPQNGQIQLLPGLGKISEEKKKE